MLPCPGSKHRHVTATSAAPPHPFPSTPVPVQVWGWLAVVVRTLALLGASHLVSAGRSALCCLVLSLAHLLVLLASPRLYQRHRQVANLLLRAPHDAWLALGWQGIPQLSSGPLGAGLRMTPTSRLLVVAVSLGGYRVGWGRRGRVAGPAAAPVPACCTLCGW